VVAADAAVAAGDAAVGAGGAAHAAVPAADASQVKPIDYFDGACLRPPHAFPASSMLSRLANVYSCAGKNRYDPNAAEAALLRDLQAATPAAKQAGAPAATAAANGARDVSVPTSSDAMKKPISKKKGSKGTAQSTKPVTAEKEPEELKKRIEQAQEVARKIKEKRLREQTAGKAAAQGKTAAQSEPEPEPEPEVPVVRVLSASELEEKRIQLVKRQRDANLDRKKKIKDDIAKEVISLPLFFAKSYNTRGGGCTRDCEILLHPLVLTCLKESEIFTEVMEDKDYGTTERQAIVCCLLMRLLPPLDEDDWWTMPAKQEFMWSILALTRSYEMGAAVPTRLRSISNSYFSTQLAIMAHFSIHPAITKEYAGAAANTTAEGMMNEHRLSIVSLMKYLLPDDYAWFVEQEKVGIFCLADPKLWECVSPIPVSQECFSRMSLNMCLTLAAALVLCAVPNTCRRCLVQWQRLLRTICSGAIVRFRLASRTDGRKTGCSRSRRCRSGARWQAIRTSRPSCPPTLSTCTTIPSCTTRG
jgi:hypothetical protein